jgi:hypothetical protein
MILVYVPGKHCVQIFDNVFVNNTFHPDSCSWFAEVNFIPKNPVDVKLIGKSTGGI